MTDEILEKNKKNFNRYVFLSTFSRNLIETFVGTILIKAGFGLKSVIFYYMLINIFSFFLAFPCIYVSKKYTNKTLSIIGILSFVVLQLCLNKIYVSTIYLFVIAFLYALYRRNYWMSRRYYTLHIVDKKNISKQFSLISFFNQLAVIIASYVGALLLEYVNTLTLTIVSILLLFISTYFIFKLNIDNEKNDVDINVLETIRCTPLSSIIYIGCYELQNVLSFLLPIYIFMYIKSTYTAIGLVNLIAQLATLLFIYVYGKLIDKNKNYLVLSVILLVLFKLLQVNTFGIVLFIITFINGLTSKMYEQSFNKELLILSKNFEFHNFNLLYECVQNLFRVFVVAMMLFLVDDIKYMIYMTLIFMFIPVFLKFKTVPNKGESKVIWKE